MPSSAEQPPRGRPILIVEDELLVALELEVVVEEAGFAVVGPAPSITAGQTLLDQGLPAAALLDVNLAGHSIEPLARRLHDAGVPFALHTGYTEQHLKAPVLRAAPRLPKPLDRRRLRHLLDELLAAR